MVFFGEQQFSYILTVSEEEEIELTIEATLTDPGRPATGPTYSCGGTPAEPPEWELKAEHNGKPFPLTDSEYEEIYTYISENWNWN